MEKAEKLAALNEEWAKKDLPLKAGATNDVPGEGNPDADVVFVGEGPGAEEDKQGRPFVGAAGKFLTELIESIGMTRERCLPAGRQVFIANIVKHRPPGNRDPLPEEIEAYTPWLDEQLAIIEPKLLVPLGRFAMDYLLGGSNSISKIHGQPKRLPAGRQGKHRLVVMPMYHPAAALYRGDLRPVLKEDFAKIPKVLEMVKAGVDQEEPAVAGGESFDKAQDKQASLL